MWLAFGASFTSALFVSVCRAQTLRGNDCTAAGAYTLCQNLWGANTGVGSQTTDLISSADGAASWSTTYTWDQSPNTVKSYPNLYHNTAKGMQLSEVTSAPTTWQWKYQSADADLRADVSYDIWTGVPRTGDPASAASSFEIMIWLSQRGGVGGIGGVVAGNINVGGHRWNLHRGPNSNWDVLSFITAEGDITDFSADLNDFFKYLIKEQGVASSQYIQAIQAGTEPFTGSATLINTHFAVDVHTAADSPPPSPPPPPPPSSSSTSSHTSTPTSSHNSTTHTTASSSAPAPPDGSGDAPIMNPGVRVVGQTQCRLRGPEDTGTLARRGWRERLGLR